VIEERCIYPQHRGSVADEDVCFLVIGRRESRLVKKPEEVPVYRDTLDSQEDLDVVGGLVLDPLDLAEAREVSSLGDPRPEVLLRLHRFGTQQLGECGERLELPSAVHWRIAAAPRWRRSCWNALVVFASGTSRRSRRIRGWTTLSYFTPACRTASVRVAPMWPYCPSISVTIWKSGWLRI
jgi:hypothetical protein